MARSKQSAPEHDSTNVIERPDGFYWVDPETDTEYGPFPTLLDALQETEYSDETDYEPGETLLEAEDELGINDWVDPDTGEIGEGFHHYFD